MKTTRSSNSGARVAIMTLVGHNYGNRLQNYALQQAIYRAGTILGATFCVDTLRPAPRSRLREAVVPWARRAEDAVRHNRRGRFQAFDDRYISYARQRVDLGDPSSLARLARSYDAFVIGSDQVWNPDFPFTSDAEYLPFVPSGKKLAYAASFGVSTIGRHRGHTAGMLDAIPSISLREDAGAAIVKDLTGRDVPVVLDPAMLLGANDWARVEKEPAMPGFRADVPYCLVYVLGEATDRKGIEDLCGEQGLCAVDIGSPSLPVGPAEFVWLVHHASLVCTDSFHASVFSLLFHTPFAIFERKSHDADMSSRFDTLCSTFDLQFRRAADPAFDAGRALSGNGWQPFEATLADLRAASFEYLCDALGKALERA